MKSFLSAGVGDFLVVVQFSAGGALTLIDVSFAAAPDVVLGCVEEVVAFVVADLHPMALSATGATGSALMGVVYWQAPGCGDNIPSEAEVVRDDRFSARLFQ